MSQTQHLYKGYSSHEYLQSKTFGLYDVKLVEMDILNYIFTPLGTRLRLPLFGTTIPNLLFEPLTESLISTVTTQMQNAINYDPRVQLISMQTEPVYSANSLLVTCVLLYIELNETIPLTLNLQFGQ